MWTQFVESNNHIVYEAEFCLLVSFNIDNNQQSWRDHRAAGLSAATWMSNSQVKITLYGMRLFNLCGVSQGGLPIHVNVILCLVTLMYIVWSDPPNLRLWKFSPLLSTCVCFHAMVTMVTVTVTKVLLTWWHLEMKTNNTLSSFHW